MDKKNQNQEPARTDQAENKNTTREDVQKAHEQADRDMANDPEFTAKSPNDDLDEGESARLGENVKI